LEDEFVMHQFRKCVKTARDVCGVEDMMTMNSEKRVLGNSP